MSSPAWQCGGGGGGAIPAGLRLSTAENRGETDLEREMAARGCFLLYLKPSKPLVYIGGEEGEGCTIGQPFLLLCKEERRSPPPFLFGVGFLLPTWKLFPPCVFFLLKTYEP